MSARKKPRPPDKGAGRIKCMTCGKPVAEHSLRARCYNTEEGDQALGDYHTKHQTGRTQPRRIGQ